MNNLEALIECYLDICQYEKKLSQDTLKAYELTLLSSAPLWEARRSAGIC